MKLPIGEQMCVLLALALAAAPMWAASPWRRRALRPLMGGKWRRSNAVCTIQKLGHELLAAATNWLNFADDEPGTRQEIAAQANAIVEQITNRLLNLRGFYGLSRRQRGFLIEMVSRLTAFAEAIVQGAQAERISDDLAEIRQIIDDRSDHSEWPLLMMRYRFWPFPVPSPSQGKRTLASAVSEVKAASRT